MPRQIALLATLSLLAIALLARGAAPVIAGLLPGDDRRLSDMGPDGTPAYAARAPATAYNPTTGQYLVVWHGDDALDNRNEIYGQLLDARTGAETGPNDILIASMGANANTDAEYPAVAYNAALNEFLVVYAGNDAPTGTTYEIYARRVAATGVPIGAPLRVSSMGASDSDGTFDAFEPQVAADASGRYLIVWHGDDSTDGKMEIYGQLLGVREDMLAEIGADDFPISDPFGGTNIAYQAREPSVAWNSTTGQYLVIWAGDTGEAGSGFTPEIWGQILNADGSTARNDFPISAMGTPSDANTGRDPSVAYNPITDEYLVVWAGRTSDDTTPHGYARRLAADGSFPAGQFRFDSGGSPAYTFQAVGAPRVAYSPSFGEYLIVWRAGVIGGTLAAGETELFGARLRNDATLTEGVLRISTLGADGVAGYNALSATVACADGATSTCLVAYDGQDDGPADGSGTEIFSKLVISSADLQVTITRTSPANPVPGGPATYMITYRNAGPDTIDGVVLTDSIPAGITPTGWSASGVTGPAPVQRAGAPYTWDIGALAPGQGGTITINGTVDTTATDGTVIANVATIAADKVATDPTPNNNSASAVLTVTEPALALSVGLLTPTAGIDAGDTVRYQIVMAHTPTSHNDAYHLTLTGALPPLLHTPTLVSAVISDGTTNTDVTDAFAISDGALATTGTIALLQDTNGSNDQQLTVIVQGTVADSITPGDTIATSAHATWKNSAGLRRSTYTASGSAPTITVSGLLNVTKRLASASGHHAPGNTVTFAIETTVFEGTTKSLQYNDTLPTGLTYVPNSVSLMHPAGMTVSGINQRVVGQTLTLDIASVMNPGTVNDPAALDSDRFTITYQATIGAGASNGTILVNRVDASAAGLPPDTDNQASVTVDLPPSLIDVARSWANPTNAASVTYTVTFSEDVSGVDATDFTLITTGSISGAALTGLSGSGAIYTATVSTGSGDGTIRLDLVDDDSIVDTYGLPLGGAGTGNGGLTGGAEQTYQIDRAAPTVVLATAASDPTNANPIPVTVTFSEPVTGLSLNELTLTNATAHNLAGSGASYSFDLVPSDQGSVSVSLPANGAQDAAGNGNTASTTLTRRFDHLAPSAMIAPATGQTNPTGSAPIRFRVVFDEPVSGFAAAGITFTGSTVPGTLAATVIESGPMDGTTYAVTVSGMTGAGEVHVSLAANAAQDAAGNGSAASGSVSVTFNPSVPVVTGIVPTGANPTNVHSVSFNVTFSEPVAGVDTGDFSLATSGLTGAAIGAVRGSGTNWTVLVNTGSGDGTLGVNLVDYDSIVATASQIALGGSGAGNGSYTGATVTIDRTAPTVALSAPNVTTGGGTDYTFTVTYADGVAVLAGSLGNGNLWVTGPRGFSQMATLVGVTPAGDGAQLTATYRITAPGGTWDVADSGFYRIALVSDQVRDTAGNSAAAGTLGGFDVALGVKVVLPLAQAGESAASAPDLIVERISTAGGTVQVTIRNIGAAPVAVPFWVDLYIAPRAAPAGVNQTWPTLGARGMAWGVDVALPVGSALTLVSGDRFYRVDFSNPGGPIAAGTQLYAQVDSANTATDYGAVRERHEISGGPYNNILGATATTSTWIRPSGAAAALAQAGLAERR
jgi:fimbrial isopeptide formation D2 family protein/uncharacterized repeat protein (TIGR01451 family)